MGNAVSLKDLSNRLELTAYIMQHIWKNRNQWTFNFEKLAKMEIVQKVWPEWSEYKDEHLREKQVNERIPRLDKKEGWKLPEVEGMKLNVSSFHYKKKYLQ